MLVFFFLDSEFSLICSDIHQQTNVRSENFRTKTLSLPLSVSRDSFDMYIVNRMMSVMFCW